MTITLDADLALEAMTRLGLGGPQDAVELLVRDHLSTGRRTQARTGGSRDGERFTGPAPAVEEG